MQSMRKTTMENIKINPKVLRTLSKGPWIAKYLQISCRGDEGERIVWSKMGQWATICSSSIWV